MRVFDLGNPGQVVPVSVPRGHRIYPEDSIFLTQTPVLEGNGGKWDRIYGQIRTLLNHGITERYVFIDGSYDPIRSSDRDIQENIGRIQELIPQSKVALLSSRVYHWCNRIPNVIYVPYFIYVDPTFHKHKKRKGRIGCLNRNNSYHRMWLMHNLLKEGLLDPKHDVYSVNFWNFRAPETINDPVSIRGWLGGNSPYDIDYEINKWPKEIATHPDGFPNDYSTDHPAWSTAISIITETESGFATLLSEKTWKGIRSLSCWTAYMAEEGYKFLEDVGFEPRFFKKHASFDNINPILSICRTLDTESAALDYYYSKKNQIDHNFEWSGGSNEDNFRDLKSPWLQKFLPEFNRQLNSL